MLTDRLHSNVSLTSHFPLSHLRHPLSRSIITSTKNVSNHRNPATPETGRTMRPPPPLSDAIHAKSRHNGSNSHAHARRLAASQVHIRDTPTRPSVYIYKCTARGRIRATWPLGISPALQHCTCTSALSIGCCEEGFSAKCMHYYVCWRDTSHALAFFELNLHTRCNRHRS